MLYRLPQFRGKGQNQHFGQALCHLLENGPMEVRVCAEGERTREGISPSCKRGLEGTIEMSWKITHSGSDYKKNCKLRA